MKQEKYIYSLIVGIEVGFQEHEEGVWGSELGDRIQGAGITGDSLKYRDYWLVRCIMWQM